jgi:hypothetical protein
VVALLAMTSTAALPLVVDPSLWTTAHLVLRPRTGTYGSVIAPVIAAQVTPGSVIAPVIAAQVTPGPIAPPATPLRPVGVALKGPINGPPVLLPRLKGPALKEPIASNVCAVLRPRSGSLVWACAVLR